MGVFLPDRNEESGGESFFSAERTEDKAATAAALWDPELTSAGFGEAPRLGPDDELNAEFKAAKAAALWVCPPPFVPFDLS